MAGNGYDKKNLLKMIKRYKRSGNDLFEDANGCLCWWHDVALEREDQYRKYDDLQNAYASLKKRVKEYFNAGWNARSKHSNLYGEFEKLRRNELKCYFDTEYKEDNWHH